ncbi:hypothetical protein [Paenibacillus solani]|uniref:Uncharacterized protein n=1 Tax=Paenibacillus solani TaxID=1705565 RepID=A0A0M1P5Z8_9BACL|nr:hypothetical protein [Paenibacillus solani]KOR89837.1 hypothetical protein AM231_12290 [Paenibacillus solani]
MKKSAWKLGSMMLLVLIMMTTVGVASSNQYEPVPDASNQEAAYINNLEIRDGKVYLEVDPIEWYEGEEANRVFREREQDPEMTEAPDGYYIVNDTEEQIELPVADDAEVLLQIYDHTGRYEDAQISWNQLVDLNKFINIYEKDDIVDMKWFPFHLTIEDGTVVKIIQQYVP